MKTLLQLTVAAFAQGLLSDTGSEGFARVVEEIPSVPEPELARLIWQSYQQLAAHTHTHTHTWSHHLAAALAISPFWRPHALHLAHLPDDAHALHHLAVVGQQLQHLELAVQAQALPSLAAGCPQLRCLSLRGCTQLQDAALSQLAPLSALQALDVCGLEQLTDVAAFHIAHLPSLAHLNLSHTHMTDAALEMLTYGHRAAAWARQAGAQLPPEVAAWRPLPLRVLRCVGLRLTPAGLQPLLDLPALALLDVRRTGLPRSALQPLQQRFGLQLIQGAVLTSSNALAAAVVNYDAIACACPPREPLTEMEEWAAQGALLLLRACPARGAQPLLEPGAGEGGGGQAVAGAAPSHQEHQPATAAATAAAGAAGGSDEPAWLLRKRGYRGPRAAPGGRDSKKRPKQVGEPGGRGGTHPATWTPPPPAAAGLNVSPRPPLQQQSPPPPPPPPPPPQPPWP